MLRYETVDSATLELLKKLQAIDAFKELRLVGGTSLALQYGQPRRHKAHKEKTFLLLRVLRVLVVKKSS